MGKTVFGGRLAHTHPWLLNSSNHLKSLKKSGFCPSSSITKSKGEGESDEEGGSKRGCAQQGFFRAVDSTKGTTIQSRRARDEGRHRGAVLDPGDRAFERDVDEARGPAAGVRRDGGTTLASSAFQGRLSKQLAAFLLAAVNPAIEHVSD